MEELIEIILDLVFEGGLEMAKSKKVPKPIRFIIIAIIILIFALGIGLIYLTAYLVLKKSLIVSIIFFVLASIMLIGIITKFRREYLMSKYSKPRNKKRKM